MSNYLQVRIFDLWNSPTLMTWMSYATRALTLVGILPLILKKFSPEDIVIWYLFSTILTIQALADFGFRQTFSRIISFAYGGAEKIDIIKVNNRSDNEVVSECNKDLLISIVSCMMFLYKRLTFAGIILMVIFGTICMLKPISYSSSVEEAWIAWCIVIIGSAVGFFSKVYMNFLEGFNKIALVRRVETFTSLGSIVCSLVVLIWFPSLLNLVIVSQAWILVASVRDWFLCTRIEKGIFKEVNLGSPIDRGLLKQIWQPAWRSGIGGIMSTGVTNFTSIIYAQIESSALVASYLLAMRLITQLREVSMAPFYSKLPLLAIYRIKNDMNSLKGIIKRGMRLSHGVFVIGFIGITLFIKPFLYFINAEVTFIDIKLWLCIGWAFYAHRFGAMHIQVYMSTNHVISHIADGLAGLIFIIISYFLSFHIGIYAIPISMMISYMGYYCWYTTIHSLRSLNEHSFWKFESNVSIPFIIILILFSIVELINDCHETSLFST